MTNNEKNELQYSLYILLDSEYIVGEVYSNALKIIEEIDKKTTCPKVFTHGPDSVVFNWTYPEYELYWTITANKKSEFLSSNLL